MSWEIESAVIFQKYEKSRSEIKNKIGSQKSISVESC